MSDLWYPCCEHCDHEDYESGHPDPCLNGCDDE